MAVAAPFIVQALVATAVSYGISTIANALQGPENLGEVVGPRLGNLQVQNSSYGDFIKQVYGKNRIAGNIIWSQDIKEVETRTEQTSGGKGGGRGTTQTGVFYSYFITLAVAICEGPVDALLRVWADGVPVDLSLGTYRFYTGSEEQLPDTYIEGVEGVGSTPAYRGLCYIVVEDFPLATYGNRVPNFNFEVYRKVALDGTVEDKVTDIVLIPGSGEFVYDTVEQTKLNGYLISGQFAEDGSVVSMNSHNYEGRPNVLVALDDMKRTLPNVQNVAVVVNWFASTIEANTCTIVPKVEFSDSGAKVTPNDWAVAGLTRATASVVNSFPDLSLTYGGTPSDLSVVRLVKYLNQTLGLNVMLYPIPLVDITDPLDPKPWRGRITTAASASANTRIQNFFQGTDKYNNFVLHYTNLVTADGRLMDYCDSIVVGSELVGLTKVHWPAASGTFPAVNELISLAGSVKTALASGGNSDVKVIYAADWSEYHSTEGGWFNLDPLWASSNIDIIGIDNYMPLTPILPQSEITKEKITEYFEKGEGWEYFYTDSENKTGQTNFTPSDGTSNYAWKNIKRWWQAATHVNPDATNNWPGSEHKPIWFTEFGFPSVSSAANQPNVFFDPTSSESSFPVGSSGRIDYIAQRDAIEAFIDYWDGQKVAEPNLVQRKYLWTWDARPYPYWPSLKNVWADYPLYKYGHWIQGKFGTATLAALVAELCERVGLVPADYNVGGLSDLVYGFSITEKNSVRSSLESLKSAYQFDMVESAGVLTFVPRGNLSIATVQENDLVLEKNNSSFVINRAQKQELPTTVDVKYIDLTKDYQTGTQTAKRQTVEERETVTVSLPIVTTEQHAQEVADISLYSSWLSSTAYKFKLPAKYCRIEPTDVITVSLNGVSHQMRIVETNIYRHGLQEVSAVADDVSSYDFYTEPGVDQPTLTERKIISETGVVLLDIPALPGDSVDQVSLRIAAYTFNGNSWSGAVLNRSDDGGESVGNTFFPLKEIESASVSGVVPVALTSGPENVFDYGSQIEVVLNNGSLSSVNELSIMNGSNAAILGSEVIQFKTATFVSEKRYILKDLLRGRLGTEQHISTHTANERFVLLDTTVQKISLPLNLFGLLRHYKSVTIGTVLDDATEQEFTYNGNCLKPYSVVHLEGVYSSVDIILSWVRRTRVNGDWKDGIDVPLSEESEKYEIEIMSGSTVLRTINATSTTVTYTQAQQTADFGGGSLPLTTLKVRVYQISSVVGRGFVNEKTLVL
jgi:hypothetical protein